MQGVYTESIVNKTDLIQTLSELVAIPSVSSDPIACAEVITYVKAAFEEQGFFVRSDMNRAHPWLLATTQDTLQPDIVLDAHLDVAPGSVDLFTLRIDNDKLCGRGVYDMKFAAACYIELLRTHAAELKQRNIGFLFTTDEEDGGLSVFDIMASGFRPGAILIPDGGDNWHVEGRAKGLLGIELTALGKTAHASRPWEGSNALDRIMNIATALRDEFPQRDRNDSTLSITGIHSGDAVNQIPASARAFIDFRSFDAREIQHFLGRVHALSEVHDATVILRSTGDPVLFDPAHPTVQGFLRTFEAFTGKPVAYLDSYGATDARYFAKENIPCIIVSPNGGNRHADDEWVAADDLQRYYELLVQWVVSSIGTDMSADEENEVVSAFSTAVN